MTALGLYLRTFLLENAAKTASATPQRAENCLLQQNLICSLGYTVAKQAMTHASHTPGRPAAAGFLCAVWSTAQSSAS